MEWLVLSIVGLLSGICASLGIGGGFVLLLYLTAVASAPQLEAQLLNLIFFLPIAIIALILHSKNHLIIWKVVWPAVIGGVLGVFIGAGLANWLSNDWLRRIFAVFILLLGIREVFFTKKQKESPPVSGDSKK